MAKRRRRTAAAPSRYRRDQLAKRAAVNESLIATVVAPQAPSPLPLQAQPAGRDDDE